MTGPTASTPDPRAVHAAATVVDLHAHPSMKTWFAGARFGERQTRASAGFNLTKLRTSYAALVAGGVKLLCSVVYVPEKELGSDCWVIRLGSLVIPRLHDALKRNPLDVALDMLTHIESEVAAVTAGGGAIPIRVVKSHQELDAALAAGAIAVVHTIEGAHVLNADPANVARLAQRGVAMITLAHFYPNGVAPPVDAIPSDFLLRRFGCFKFEEDLSAGLTTVGRGVVEEMHARGVIVDLTHCTPRARRDVYGMSNPRRRPLVMSHVGAATLLEHPMNATAEDARAIAATGGVVGVIFYNHWLTHDHERHDTLQHVVRHVEALVNLGGEDLVAFGSDFDGITDPPEDLREPGDWPNLTAALLRHGFTTAQVEKFLGLNARRVLRDGWGSSP